MQHFTEEQKQIAVDLYLSEGNNTRTVREKLGYPSPPCLMKWVRQDPRYDDSKKPRAYNHYDKEQKMRAVELRLSGKYSTQTVADMVGAHGSQISRWTNDYLKGGPKALEPKHNKKDQGFYSSGHEIIPESKEIDSVSDEGLREYCEDLKFENDVLRAELEYLSKKYQASVSKRSIIEIEPE